MSDMKETNQLTRIVEGLLFAAEKPLSIDRLLELFEESDRPEKNEIKEIIAELQAEYAQRGIELKELATGYRFVVRADLAKWVQRLWEERAPRYSRALLETLALIAYRQPITRSEIEDIRGVAVNTNIVKTLLEREWIRIVGYRDVPGKPALLASTKEFLDYFGLRSLEELPPLSELQDLEKLGAALSERLQEENQSLDEAESEFETESGEESAQGTEEGGKKNPEHDLLEENNLLENTEEVIT